MSDLLELEKVIMKSNLSYSTGSLMLRLAKSSKSRLTSLKLIEKFVTDEIALIESKKVVKKVTVKKKTKLVVKRNANIYQRKFRLSDELADITGEKIMLRTQVVYKVWEYIKKHNLQNPKNKRNILCDEKLKAVFKKKEVTMFELSGIINTHLTEIK